MVHVGFLILKLVKTSKRNPKFTSTQISKMILNCMDSNECDGVYYEIKIIAGLFGK